MSDNEAIYSESGGIPHVNLLNKTPFTTIAEGKMSDNIPEVKTEEFDTQNTDFPVCPECGHSHKEMKNKVFDMREGRMNNFTCKKCGKEFFISFKRIVKFDTWRKYATED